VTRLFITNTKCHVANTHCSCSLLQRIGACLGALAVLLRSATRDTDGADNFTIHEERDATFDCHGGLEL
jgi:hypothetical protein